MKKVIAVILVLIILVGCSNTEPSKSEPEIPQIEFSVPNENVCDHERGTKYVVVLEIKQSHFTLDLAEHMKDKFNSLEIPISVDKDFYDTYDIGDSVSEEFRWGSFWLKGSFGNWKIKVKDKQSF